MQTIIKNHHQDDTQTINQPPSAQKKLQSFVFYNRDQQDWEQGFERCQTNEESYLPDWIS